MFRSAVSYVTNAAGGIALSYSLSIYRLSVHLSVGLTFYLFKSSLWIKSSPKCPECKCIYNVQLCSLPYDLFTRVDFGYFPITKISRLERFPYSSR